MIRIALHTNRQKMLPQKIIIFNLVFHCKTRHVISRCGFRSVLYGINRDIVHRDSRFISNYFQRIIGRYIHDKFARRVPVYRGQRRVQHRCGGERPAAAEIPPGPKPSSTPQSNRSIQGKGQGKLPRSVHGEICTNTASFFDSIASSRPLSRL